jgi:hypothetical protein
LGSVINGKAYFDLKGKRKNNTKEERTQVQYEQDYSLTLRVTTNIPLIKISFNNLQPRIWNGELKKCIIEIKNIGKSSFQVFSVKVSHPQFITFGKGSNMNENFLGEEDVENKEKIVPDAFFDNLSIYKIPLKYPLEPNKAVMIPCFIRGTKVGQHNLDFMFYYEPTDKNEHCPYRLYSINQIIEVSSSLQLRTFSQSSIFSNQSFIFGLNIKNLRNDDRKIEIDQITSISKRWKIEPLGLSEE